MRQAMQAGVGVLFFCVAIAQSQSQGNSIHGTVTDAETGQPIDRFRVIKGVITLNLASQPTRFDPASTMEFRNGKYDVPYPSRIPSAGGGGYVLRIEADGYNPEVTPPVRATPLGIDDSTFNIKLRKATPLSGIIKLPSGAPAGKAEVHLVTSAMPLWLSDNQVKTDVRPVASGASTTTTDDAGRFSLSRERPGFLIFAIHSDGYAILQDIQIANDGVIQLQPWGRVSGIVRSGSKGLAEKTIAMTKFVSPGPASSQLISIEYTAQSDVDGKFVFDRVAADDYVISKIAANVRDGLIISELNGYAPVIKVESGKTLEFNIGSSAGRSIIGHAVLDDRSAARISAISVRIFTPNRNVTGEEGRETYLKTRRVYDAKLQADGSFQVEQIEPGEYTMLILARTNADQLRAGNGSAYRQYQADLKIPQIDENAQTPLDLGAVQFKNRVAPARGG